ncbi:hypothetical protein D3C78_1592960 [compost metagenome]
MLPGIPTAIEILAFVVPKVSSFRKPNGCLSSPTPDAGSSLSVFDVTVVVSILTPLISNEESMSNPMVLESLQDAKRKRPINMVNKSCFVNFIYDLIMP